MIDVILSDKFRWLTGHDVVDPKNFQGYVDATSSRYVDIPPGGFVLGMSVGLITTPIDRLGIVMPRSTYLRCGLDFGSGFLHPGWCGKLVLELGNKNKTRALRIYVGEPIASVAFVIAPEAPVYVGKYQDHNFMRPVW